MAPPSPATALDNAHPPLAFHGLPPEIHAARRIPGSAIARVYQIQDSAIKAKLLRYLADADFFLQEAMDGNKYCLG
jgi:hypothetical protein